MKIAMIKKAVWYGILCGVSAAMPPLLAAISACETISSVPWLSILDEHGVTFFVAAMGGMGIGGGKAAIQKKEVKK